MTKTVENITSKQIKNTPSFSSGDTVVVSVKVKEGKRERIQAFEGVVVAIKNRGISSSFTVRKISYGEGVERVFQTHSPLIDSIKVKRRGDVRRAKLYYLRENKIRKVSKNKRKANLETFTLNQVFKGIGSNQNHPHFRIYRALKQINRMHDTRLIQSSNLYESIPLGPKFQPNFINAVAEIKTILSP